MSSLIVTAVAAHKIADVLKDEAPGSYVRISLKGGACAGMTHEIIVANDYDAEDDTLIEQDGAKIILDSITASYMKGVELDWVRVNLNQEGFKFSGGAISRSCGCGKSYAYDKDKV